MPDSSRSQAEEEVAALTEARQLELEKQVELERTVENGRAQIRALSQLHSAERQAAAALRAEVEQLRGMMKGLPAPPASSAVELAENKRGVAEARAQASEAQLEALEEAMRIARAENERQLLEIRHLRSEQDRAASGRLSAQQKSAEGERALRHAEQKLQAAEASAALLGEKYAAGRGRLELAQAQLGEAQQQLGAQELRLEEAAADRAELKARRAGDAAAAGSGAQGAAETSRVELQRQLAASQARCSSLEEELKNRYAEAARVAQRAEVQMRAREEARRPRNSPARNSCRAMDSARNSLTPPRSPRRRARCRR